MINAPFKWTAVGDLLVSCVGAGPVPDVIFSNFLNDLNTLSVRKYLACVVGSAEVTSVQRKAGAEIAKRRALMTAVVTDERLVRGMVTAVSWLGVDIKAFSWQELTDAVAYLKIPATMEQQAITTINELKRSVLTPTLTKPSP